MIMKRAPFLLAAITIMTQSTLAAPPTETQINWLQKNAIAFNGASPTDSTTDLEPLRKMIGDARIVSLGEGTHGTREFFQMKHRITQFLAAEMGFTIFSIEANMPEAYRLNDYVLHGQGDPKKGIAGMYFWTWNTQEVLDMVEWMREFNKAGSGRIEFTGFDMQTETVAADIALTFLQKVDPELHAEAKRIFENTSGAKGQQNKFGVATATMPRETALGKKLRFSAWIKTEDVRDGFAGLWWRCDGPEGILAFDNMQSQNITGSRDWREYSLELDIPAETKNINFGMINTGTGTAWFDDLKIELDGKRYTDPTFFTLDFERDMIKGFFTPPSTYDVELDTDIKHGGAKSLRMRAPAAADAEKPDSATLTDQCAKLLEKMESKRGSYVAATSAKETDWAMQNARIVHQKLLMLTNRVSRDESMARNVKWILDHAPKDTKIVLWAHNGHVQRGKMMGGMVRSMGDYLNEWYGDDQVIVGFTTQRGDYRAVARGKGLRSGHKLQPPQAGSVEEYFAAVDKPQFIVDLQQCKTDDEASSWLTKRRLMRSIGALEMPYQFAEGTPSEQYDILIHFAETESAKAIGAKE